MARPIAMMARLSCDGVLTGLSDMTLYNHLSFDGGPVKRRAALDVGGRAKDGKVVGQCLNPKWRQ